ncbi:MAG: hypothetical protein EBX37_11885, partial [Alphaproteobacteria bacterium]|nr:hypothetical protein [Alphaproteobacteria bacterium]
MEYDRERGIVTARGRVEAWQNERILRADTFIYDRQSGIATVRGNVQLMEADGQVLFAEEAELGEGFREGVLTGVRALLAANARLVANGARRTPVPVPEGAPPGTQPATFTDLTRVVYSSCNLCESDPSRPPLWQVRARTATQDTDVQRVAYRDAHYLAAVMVFVLVYVAIVALSLPGATVASLTGGFLFGLFPGVFFNVAGAVAGSALVFLAARNGLAPMIEGWAGPGAKGHIARLRRALRAREWQVLFLMRLTPIVPFFVANLVPAAMGTRMSRFVIT